MMALIAGLPSYPVVTVIAIVAAVVFDQVVVGTNLLRDRTFWVALAIMFFFQIFIDGWLTRADGTIVNYDNAETLGIRVFFNTPIEDFGFGFALIVATLALWRWSGHHDSQRAGR